MYTNLKERDVEALIDNELKNLKWQDNPKKGNCNVFRQRAKTKEQEKKLQGKRPDYILYPDNSDNPLAVIEVKRPHEDIYKAEKQAINYAKKIDAPVVFSTDGIFTKTLHLKKQKPLYLNGEEVEDLLRQSILVNYLHDNIYTTQDKKVLQSRQELISVFKNINELFRDAGVRTGLERIELLSNILFLKVISELREIEDDTITAIPEHYLWNNFKNKKGLELLSFLNRDAFKYFKENYGGEVLSKIDTISPGKEKVLNKVIDKLDGLQLSDTNSDIKGDAFEFFLRNYGGAETDFGEYFTPRHIVKTMVKLLNPRFGEKVYDPFCGTGGMLIESFKHIKKRMPQNKNSLMMLKEETIYGTEFTTMSRVAKMNMILAGDGHSNIKRRDSYQHRQSGEYDVVITNIPFGKKMKTEYLGNYGYSGNSAELAGILHCLDAMSNSSSARAAIIVPEGITFNGSKLYTSLRKELVEKYELENIISLPQGVFTDTGVKSNILIVKKQPVKEKKHVWYFDVKNDGFTLDKGRRPIEGNNDLNVLKAETNLLKDDLKRLSKIGFKILYKDKLRENGYIFSPNLYEETAVRTKSNIPFVKLGDVCDEIKNGKNVSQIDTPAKYRVSRIQSISDGTFNLKKTKWTNDEVEDANFLRKGDILFSHINSLDHIGKTAIYNLDEKIVHGANLIRLRISNPNILPEYLIRILKSSRFIKIAKSRANQAVNQCSINTASIKTIEIPLPPIGVQEEIVDEVEGYQKIIDGCRMVIANYKPTITIDPAWKMMELGDVCEIVNGRAYKREELLEKGKYPVLRVGNFFTNSKWYYSNLELEDKKYCHKGDLLYAWSASFGAKIWDGEKTIFHYHIWKINSNPKIINKFFLKCILGSITEALKKSEGRGGIMMHFTKEGMEKRKIPIPPMAVQEEIVREIEQQQVVIDGNKRLLEIFQQKIHSKIAQVWESRNAKATDEMA